jgi:hypothetical protein
MPDFDLDELLIDAVNDYRAQTLSRIEPAGAQAARATAAHRKRIRVVTIGVVAVLVVTPLAAYASTRDHGTPAVTATPSTVASPVPSTSSGPSASPSGTPSATPSSTPSSTRPNTAGPISEQQLANATLQFPSKPSWNPTAAVGFCPSGKVTLSHGRFTGKAGGSTPNAAGEGLITMVRLGNATDDVAAIFGCQRSDPGMQIALGFRRDSSGTIRTLGEIDPGIVTFRGIASSGSGTVRVQVSIIGGSDGREYARQVLQWRTFRWNGRHYTQTAGSTSFTTSRNLHAQASDVTFGPEKNGIFTGTMTVALHNSSGSRMSDVSVVFVSGDPFEPGANPSCAALSYGGDLPGSGVCRVGSIAAGANATVTLRFIAISANAADLRSHPDLGATDMLIQVRIGDQALAKQPVLGKAVFH